MMLADKLCAGLEMLDLDLSAQQQKQLLDYLTMIVKWNAVYNLTAIRDTDQMLTHHLLDSLAIVRPLSAHLDALKVKQSRALRLLDVGAGAGLPGVVIAICRPDVQIICVDAVGKKAAFVSQTATALGLTNLQGVHARVEKMPDTIRLDGFDVITSRAFATLADFVELTKNLLAADGGVWMAMKAKTASVESVGLPKDVAVFHVEQLNVPDLHEERCLVWMRR